MANRWWLNLLGVFALGLGTVGLNRATAHEGVRRPLPLEDNGHSSLASSQAETTLASKVVGATEVTFTGESPSESCPSDMVEIQGEYCQGVAQYCKEYISEKRDRCAVYSEQVRCLGKTKRLHFCIDRYEYPNRAGEKPTRAVMFTEAAELCAADGKRLCTADEWTQACEGPEHLPYPYGYVRNSETCNHDKPYIMPDNDAYANPATRAAEVARVDQSEPSGSRKGCVSAYGVFDMTGNVDEWVKNEEGSFNGPPYESGLKGGYWGPVRNRCRPMTTDHNRWHSGYQIGLRCCTAPGSAGAIPKIPTPESTPNNRAPTFESERELNHSTDNRV